MIKACIFTCTIASKCIRQLKHFKKTRFSNIFFGYMIITYCISIGNDLLKKSDKIQKRYFKVFLNIHTQMKTLTLTFDRHSITTLFTSVKGDRESK